MARTGACTPLTPRGGRARRVPWTDCDCHRDSIQIDYGKGPGSAARRHGAGTRGLLVRPLRTCEFHRIRLFNWPVFVQRRRPAATLPGRWLPIGSRGTR